MLLRLRTPEFMSYVTSGNRQPRILWWWLLESHQYFRVFSAASKLLDQATKDFIRTNHDPQRERPLAKVLELLLTDLDERFTRFPSVTLDGSPVLDQRLLHFVFHTDKARETRRV